MGLCHFAGPEMKQRSNGTAIRARQRRALVLDRPLVAQIRLNLAIAPEGMQKTQAPSRVVGHPKGEGIGKNTRFGAVLVTGRALATPAGTRTRFRRRGSAGEIWLGSLLVW